MRSRPPGLLFFAACIAALALRLVLPSGWMPVATGDAVVLSLCSGGVATPDPAAPAGAADQPCAFALATGPLLLAAALVLPLVLLPLLPLPLPAWPGPVLRHRRPRPHGQGPPPR